MKRTFLLVALLAIFGSAFANSVFVSHRMSGSAVEEYSLTGTLLNTLTSQAMSISKASAGMDTAVIDGKTQYRTLTELTTNNGNNNNARVEYLFGGGTSDFSNQSPNRNHVVANDWETGKLYTFGYSGGGGNDGGNTEGAIFRSGGNSAEVAKEARSGFCPSTYIYGDNGVADIEVSGQNVYWTMGNESNGASVQNRRIFTINKNFAEGDPVSVLLEDANSIKFGGLAFDASGNLYVAVDGTSIRKYTGVTQDSGWSISGIGNIRDIDVIDGKLFVCTDSNVKVFNLDGSPTGIAFGGDSWYTAPDTLTGSSAPTTVDFVCTVTLVDWNGASLPTVTVTVDGGTPVVKTLTGSGSSGTFTLSLTPVSHDIKVKAVKSLSQTVTGSGTTPAFFLQCGDTNDDNKIDDLDFLSVIGNFGSTDPVLKLIGDGNGDDKTDDLDFLNVIGKFGTSGT